ncbi:MAG TPA: hypothetical protein VF214_04690 [Edaphobacter sp.]
MTRRRQVCSTSYAAIAEMVDLVFGAWAVETQSDHLFATCRRRGREAFELNPS